MGDVLSSLDDTNSSTPQGIVGSNDNVPSDGVLLSQLIQLLSTRPKNCLRLSDLTALLPASLRVRAKQQGGLNSWIMNYPSLFKIDGDPGKEVVVLCISSFSGESVDGNGAAPSNPPGSASQNDFTLDPTEDTEVSPLAHRNSGTFDEELDGNLAVQLRGLPYRATVEDVRIFLGSHAKHLAEDNPIHLTLNRDGRPSGFARVLFVSPEAARACRDETHLRGMEDRYVEVFLYSERPSKGRSRRAEDGPLSADRALNLADAAGVTVEQVVQECRTEMALPNKRRLLLSMLGVTLSQGARAYLKHVDQGLKHFLAQFPMEFSVDGVKGCEYVTYTPLHLSEAIGSHPPGPVAPGFQRATASTTARSPEVPPASPKPIKSPEHHISASAGRGIATPSDWGTPAPSTWGVPGAAGPWVPPWPGAGTHGGDSSGTGEATGSTDGSMGWNAPSWPLAMSQQQSMQQMWAGQGWGGSNFGSWDGSGLNPLEVAAQQGAAAAAALTGVYGCDPQAIAAAAAFYGAAAAAAVANSQSQAFPPPPVPLAGSKTGPCSANATGTGSSAESPSSGSCAIRLRGLPFTSQEQDVLAFFAQHDVVDRIADGPKAVSLLQRSNGRPSGQAVVTMRDRHDAELAQRVLNGQWMGQRYIEVFLHGEEGTELQNATAAAAVAVAAGKQTVPCSQSGPTKLSLAGNLVSGNAGTSEGATNQGMMAQFAGMQAAAWQQPNLWGQGLGGASSMMPADVSSTGACGSRAGGSSNEWQALFNFLAEGQRGTMPTGIPGAPPAFTATSPDGASGNASGGSNTTAAAV